MVVTAVGKLGGVAVDVCDTISRILEELALLLSTKGGRVGGTRVVESDGSGMPELECKPEGAFRLVQ